MEEISRPSPHSTEAREGVLGAAPVYRSPRLLFFLPTLCAGGAEFHALSLIGALRDRGFSCDLLVHGRSASKATLETPAAVSAIRLDLRGMSDPFGWVKIWREIRRLRPDIVVCVNQTPFIIAAIERFLLATHAKLVCVFHSTELQTYEAYQERPFRFLARFCELLIFVGRTQQRHWEQRGLTAQRVRVIPNGVDFGLFQPNPDARRAGRGLLGIKDEDFVLAMVAAFREEKRHEDFLHALAQAHKAGSRSVAVFVGEGPRFCAMRELAASLGIAAACRFVGVQSDVLPYIAASDAGVLCSDTETFPLVLLEFLASGKPVLISAVGGAMEIARENNRLVHEPDDIDRFAANILEMERPERRAELARGARESVREFSKEAMIEAYCQELRKLHDAA
jgi:glycosyltransferase involved in cell wall biosynthesis